MPIHDWTRVHPAVFFDFHLGWMLTLSHTLNTGVLPSDYYAMMGQTLDWSKSILVRRTSDDHIAGVVETYCPRTDGRPERSRPTVNRVLRHLGAGSHVLLLDIAGSKGSGVHSAVWSKLKPSQSASPTPVHRALVSYAAGDDVEAFVEPVAVGDVLPDMPLFLTPDTSIAVPLDASYQAALGDRPKRWRDVIDPPAG